MNQSIEADLRLYLGSEECVLAARIYGSSLYTEEGLLDIDVAVLVSSIAGVVKPETYNRLARVRLELSQQTNCDIDLVIHSEDEVGDFNSPLYNPRYNPALCFGLDVKGEFDLKQVSTLSQVFGFADLAKYVLHDNRTICRRQLTRTLDGECGRIYVSKFLHGPGNVLTYHCCLNGLGFGCNPSDFEASFRGFDRLYKVDSSPALGFLQECKCRLDFDRGLKLMRWYELLFSLVVLDGDREAYMGYCRSLDQ